MLLKRYHSLDYIFKLDIEEALSLIEYANTQVEEELLFLRWIQNWQFDFSLDEFREKLKPKKVKSNEQILEDVIEVLALFEKAGDKVG